MKRLIMICEGPTEQAFTKANLQVHFMNKGIYLQTPLKKASRGGIVKWNKLKVQVETHLKAEKDAMVTTFIDYYGMYAKFQFPGWDEAHNSRDKNLCLDLLEKSMLLDIDENLRPRFIPYLQLHEFEGLLFNDISIFTNQIPPGDLVGLDELKETFAQYDNPEMINNDRETAPSRRLERIIRGVQ